MPLSSVIPISLYVHIPWCVKKCPYCDFNSHALKTDDRSSDYENAYVTALLEDLESQLPRIWGRRIVSIFFGGGTPSLFSPQAIENILLGTHARLNFSPNIEITLEANPGTVDESRFAAFRKAGINRLSIGIQSLQNEKLKALGRIHDREYALRAIDAAIKAGFHNFNLDLMHGLPNQSLEDATADLQDALQFSPPHLSWYQLTLEPNTFFHKYPPKLPDEDYLYEIQDAGHSILKPHFNHYEISAFAKHNHECVHNKNYWEFGDYLGIGAGAHSKLTDYEKNHIVRHWQIKHPKDYLSSANKVSESKILSKTDVLFEFMLNALRLMDGFSLDLLLQRTGLSITDIKPALSLAQSKQLITINQNHIQPTELGYRFLNDTIACFLAA